MADIDDIVRGLTKAQKAGILKLDADWQRAGVQGRGVNSSSANNVYFNCPGVADKRQTMGRYGVYQEYRLTPLGIEVRARLLSSSGEG